VRIWLASAVLLRQAEATMTSRFSIRLLLTCGCIALLAQPAAAQQTLNFSLGYYAVRGEDARLSGDTLIENRDFLAFDIGDFNSATVGAEWLVPLGQYVEAGAGIGFYRRTVSSVYAGFVDIDGSEIEQDLRLRVVPFTATFRVLPLGQSSPVQPYFGGGLGVFSWRYSESGEFVDLSDHSIFRDRFVADGVDTGPVALGGIRFAGDTVASGFEVRYHGARGSLDENFLGDKIDLGGWTYQFTLGLRF
jgi:hypothetical protein